MRLTSKGQVTVPKEVRERLGLFPQSEVEFVVEGNVAYLQKREVRESRGQKLVSRMRGKATVRMSTDEIMALTRGEE